MVSSRDEGLVVLLDTNFLISTLRFGIHLDTIDDIISVSHRVVVPDNVIGELESLELRGADDRLRRLALSIARSYDRLPLTGHVDDALVEYSKTHDAAVATNDRELRKRLRETGVPVIFIRNRSSLSCERGSRDI